MRATADENRVVLASQDHPGGVEGEVLEVLGERQPCGTRAADSRVASMFDGTQDDVLVGDCRYACVGAPRTLPREAGPAEATGESMRRGHPADAGVRSGSPRPVSSNREVHLP